MRCVIIAGSPECNINFIKKVVLPDDFVICADKGYQYAAAANITPDIIVGDFDSYTGKIPSDYETITLAVHKDDTDTIHSIDVAFERGYKDFVILSAIGGRFDHTFANVSALSYIASKGGRGVLLSEKERIEFLSKGKHCFNGCKDKTFSLFPFGCQKVCVSYQGAEYPLSKYYLDSSVPMGVSNKFISNNSVVEIYDGNAIIIINLSDFDI
jgi:thiamine pyrophosphokinase